MNYVHNVDIFQTEDQKSYRLTPEMLNALRIEGGDFSRGIRNAKAIYNMQCSSRGCRGFLQKDMQWLGLMCDDQIWKGDENRD